LKQGEHELTATVNPLRERLTQNEPMFGIWLQFAHPGIAELAACAGYDIALIDMEHGPGGLMDTANMMRGVARSSTATMVRIPANDPVFLKRLLDQGPDGVMVPMVETAAEARAAVAACRYPPHGSRGWAAGVARAARFGFDPDYTLSTASQIVIACQIESVKGVENAEEIAAVDGVDILFLGRNDLAADAGHILDLDHPEVEELVRRSVHAARRHGKKVGTIPSAGRDWIALFEEGFDVVLPSGDISLLRDATSAEIRAWLEYRGKKGRGEQL
jgi:4-hydroxy-2-oxoheptanedioate aldolase